VEAILWVMLLHIRPYWLDVGGPLCLKTSIIIPDSETVVSK
jgi:hypothetical protein